MARRESLGQGSLYAARSAREAAVFAAVVALLVDGLFYLVLVDEQLSGGPLAIWSAIKVSAIVAGTAWLASHHKSWSLGFLAAVFALIGLEDSFGITAPLGLWLVEESGIRRGPGGTNSQLLRRAFVMLALAGPTVYLALRAPHRIRRATWVLVGFLGAIFIVAVVGDVAADRTGTNFDELVEEPVLSLAAGYVIGLVVDSWPAAKVRSPTRTRRR